MLIMDTARELSRVQGSRFSSPTTAPFSANGRVFLFSAVSFFGVSPFGGLAPLAGAVGSCGACVFASVVRAFRVVLVLLRVSPRCWRLWG